MARSEGFFTILSPRFFVTFIFGSLFTLYVL